MSSMTVTGAYRCNQGWLRLTTFNPAAEKQGFSPAGELIVGYQAEAPISSEQGAFGGGIRDCTPAAVVGQTREEAERRAAAAGWTPATIHLVGRDPLGGWMPLPEWARGERGAA